MFAQLPMYQQKGKTAYNAKLEGIQSFAAYLHHPEREFKVIHVAGTNGKGSSSHMLASILQEAGYTTGLYTSPHLKDFRERIRINGSLVDKAFVVDFIQDNKTFFSTHNLSFFEMSVGMAFDYFAKSKVDIAIVEVGLGGRLDSTNIVVPEVALITNIGMDHTDMLGDTLQKIAKEKAGIIKENIPVVISELQEEIEQVFRAEAKNKNSKIVFADQHDDENIKTALLGTYQRKNLRGVLAVVKELKGFEITREHIEKGLQNVASNTGLMGRWQLLGEKPTVICDTAHNREGLEMVLQQIAQQKFERLHIVLGFVREKDIDRILPLFPAHAIYYFCRPHIERGLDVLMLQKKAASFGLSGNVYDSVAEAYDAALNRASIDDFVFIGGSTFVVAEVV